MDGGGAVQIGRENRSLFDVHHIEAITFDEILVMRDSAIAALIEQEQFRQIEGVELIASENYASDQVMEAQGSILTN